MFITLEGGEGSGKSTLIAYIKEYLTALGYDVVLSREPGGSPIAEQIRDILLDKNNVGMSAECEALLYAASRAEHVRKTVKPALEAGKIVILDRYLDSSLAYQAYARGLGYDAVMAINQMAIEGLMPDVTLWLDISASDGLDRVKRHRSNKEDRLDDETLSFHERVHQGYLLLMEKYPERIKRLDAKKSIPELQASAKAILDDILKEQVC